MFFESGLNQLVLGSAALVFGILVLPLFYRHLDRALLFFVAVTPLHTIVRWLNVESVLLSGWRDLLFMFICAVWLTGILRRRFRIPAAPAILAVLLLNLAGLLQILHANTTLVWAAGFRDIIKYSLLTVVVYSVCREKPGFLRRLALVIFGIGVLVAVLQFVFYFADLDYVLRLGTIPPSYRSAGPLFFRRMEAFFGGGPSNLGLYVGVSFVIYMALRQGVQRVPRWWHVGAILLLIVLLMTLSFSAVVAIGTVCYLLLLNSHRKTGLKLTIIGIMAGALVGLAIGFDRAIVGDQEATGFLSYLINIFFKALFMENWSLLTQNTETFLVGRGLALLGAKSFLDVDDSDNLMIIGSSDGGWVEFAVQMGAIMALIMIIAIGLTMWNAWRSARWLPPRFQDTTRALLAAMLVIIASIHIIPWTRVGPDVNFWLVLGSLAYIPTLARQCRRQAQPALGSTVPGVSAPVTRPDA